MTTLVAALLTVGAVVYTLFIRPKDLPEEPPASPLEPLESRRAQIYESLRDLQFEYRTGKLSEADYQMTKLELQKELAHVLARIDELGGSPAAETPAQAEPKAEPEPATAPAVRCPHCGAEFDRPMKFCGECGRPLARGEAK